MYEKPTVQKFGSFRDLTTFGLSQSSDGISIWGVASSPGCYTDLGRYGQYEYGCPPTTS